MEKNVLRAIDGIALYPLISFGIFGLFFIGLLGYVLIVKPTLIDQMKNLPLQPDGPAGQPGFGAPQEGGTPC